MATLEGGTTTQGPRPAKSSSSEAATAIETTLPPKTSAWRPALTPMALSATSKLSVMTLFGV